MPCVDVPVIGGVMAVSVVLPLIVIVVLVLRNRSEDYPTGTQRSM